MPYNELLTIFGNFRVINITYHILIKSMKLMQLNIALMKRTCRPDASIRLRNTGSNLPKIIKYLEETPSLENLHKIINLLKIKPIELVRQNEKIWKEHFKNSNLSDDELIKIMVDNPILIERPIVINGNKAIVGRPPSKILEII